MDRFLQKTPKNAPILHTLKKQLYFSELCNIFQKIENTPKRLEIQEIITKYYKKVINTDINLLPVVLYLSIARVYPEYEGVELGIGEQILIQAIKRIMGLDKNSHKFNKIRQNRDLGDIIEEYKSGNMGCKRFKKSDMGNEGMNNDHKMGVGTNDKEDYKENATSQKPKTNLYEHESGLTISFVCQKLKEICLISGKDCKSKKINEIIYLLLKSSPIESKYLTRVLEGSLKIGLALQTVLISLGLATDCEFVKEAYNRLPDFDKLVPLLVKHKNNILDYCHVTPLIPLSPMLAQGTKDFSQFTDVCDDETGEQGEYNKNNGKKELKYIFEYKYDGERIQIHRKGDETAIFSRNKENLKEKYPEVLELAKSICVEDAAFILDAEVVAFEDKILPFQVLSTRKRKMDKGDRNLLENFLKSTTKSTPENTNENKNSNPFNDKQQEVKVCIFAFDILFYKKSLLKTPLSKRKSILSSKFIPIKNKFNLTIQKRCKNYAEVLSFFEKSISENCEGLMIKNLESFYMPSQRTNHWMKLKKDYIESADTFDLVVMGAYYGKGKRYGRYGAFLLGTYNNGYVESICKLGTGFDDETLNRIAENKLFTAASKSDALNEDHWTNKPSIYVSADSPDVWIPPSLVWEVKAADISVSPKYMCCNGYGKSLSLRFPRYIRNREDKSFEDATTSGDVWRLFNEK